MVEREWQRGQAPIEAKTMSHIGASARSISWTFCAIAGSSFGGAGTAGEWFLRTKSRPV